MKCSQCGKNIPETNQHKINCDGRLQILCGKHYSQYLKYGHFLDASPKTTKDMNEYEITDLGVWIYTFNSKSEPSGRFLIDIEDLELVLTKKWRYSRGYFMTGVQKPILIHRFLMNPSDSDVVDHINGNTYDNRRSNLRICNQLQNCQNHSLNNNNTSGISGVWFDKKRDKWAAEIMFNRKKCFLGRYENKNDAIFVRYYAETQVFKQFRSTRNDNIILPAIKFCENKTELSQYVNKRLHEKFSI